jgi:hypothetical protein
MSGNGNGGTWSGTPAGVSSTYYASGKVGLAGKFNGSDDYVIMSSSSQINFAQTNSFSISAWINPAATTGFVFDKQRNVSSEFVIDISFNGNKIVFELAKQAVASSDYFSLSTLTTGNWYHIVGTYDGTNMNFYINGVIQGSFLVFGQTGTTQGLANMYLGEQYQGANYFKGQIDDFRIYNRALSASEIQALYNAEK